MKNPQSGEWYLLAHHNDTLFITVTYSKTGVCRAWKGWSDEMLAKAGGYGYDKVSTVLADACGEFMQNDAVKNTGGCGVSTTQDAIKKAGGRLYGYHDALDFIHADIAKNKY